MTSLSLRQLHPRSGHLPPRSKRSSSTVRFLRTRAFSAALRSVGEQFRHKRGMTPLDVVDQAVSHVTPLVIVTMAATLLWLYRCCRGRRTPVPLDNAKPRRVIILYATQKGTARLYAHRVFTAVSRWRQTTPAHEAFLAAPTVQDAATCDAERLSDADIVVLVASTYTDGGAPAGCKQFRDDFLDMATDFRYGGSFLARQTFFLFGLGDVAYANNFNRFAKDLDDWIRSLGGVRPTAARFASEKRAQPFMVKFVASLLDYLDEEFRERRLQRAAGGLVGPTADRKLQSEAAPLESESSDDDANAAASADLEDVAGVDGPQGELLYPRLRQNLAKQGYQLIGSHSGVKLCRWTKAMLRGRGGCYKHTFYNISSYQCMEMTPSLACANKCVFCWRHHTNPVGKEFSWKVDEPDFLVESAIAAHRAMLKPLRGVPGVNADRLVEAMNVKHCALSLVGEPIMYPRINEFVTLMHAKHISTFLVTNAQFPDRLRDLPPVTQLYLSIDAATPEHLKAVDRPLFGDFWERMIACVQELRMKSFRTVFRLTLVEGYNMNNLADYCHLIRLGQPDFIEVKGVTYCGNSDASPITMQHVPFHRQVAEFCEQLVATLDSDPAGALEPGTVPAYLPAADLLQQPSTSGQYRIACEHEHSCCVLISHRKFRSETGAWNTWIDYAKFFDLLDAGRPFSATDYAAPTPAWAVYRSTERGFDPNHTRHFRNKRAVPGGGC
jgi:tRNA wybutosine-synthesizing protein 1